MDDIASSHGAGGTPADTVAALDAASRQVRTPCGAGEMVWRRWGAGPPLVLLHGGHGAWTHWVRNIGTLARRFTVVAADMPGYGDSAEPPPPHTAEGIARILARGIDEAIAPAERFSVVGFSFGGVIGGLMARLFPGRIDHLVLVGAGGLGVTRTPLAELRNWRFQREAAARTEAHRHNLRVLMIHEESRIDALALHVQGTNTRRARFKSRPTSMTDALRRALPETDARIAGIWGEFDATAIGHLDEREAVLRAIQPEAPFAIIAGAGHWVQFEAPERFHEALLPMLGV